MVIEFRGVVWVTLSVGDVRDSHRAKLQFGHCGECSLGCCSPKLGTARSGVTMFSENTIL